MLLLVTNRRDITTDYIVLELKKRGEKYYRLNTELLPEAECILSYLNYNDWSILLNNKLLIGGTVKGAYFRRPGKPIIPNCVVDAGARKYIEDEWGGFLKSLYMRLEGLWLNSPTNIVLAEDKPRQLLLANKIGFLLPETIITNDILQAKKLGFGNIIVKPLRQPLLSGKDERVIFTSRVPKLSFTDRESFSLAPVIVQHEISKKYDVRVTVVGNKVFPVAIWSQDNPNTEVDWRVGSRTDLKHEIINLPSEINQKCVELVSLLGLKYGAIDLICDKNNNFWFLEINPNGQWAWIENQTGLPIASAIVDELLNISLY
ncbi:hypothetical protein ACLEDZ_15120 [Lonsdalea quercina]|uniref:hypothetical protein n=1 Tax=Lonsdalea quercina TaxID=71657 RepID=UPI0039761E23